MTTKERCLEALKDNEFFQSAMQKGKMICVTHRYEPWIVVDEYIFGNQYNAINAEGKKERIYDSALCCIFNDKRLKDFYVCSQGQGTYEECKAKIDAHRSHIKQCKNCDGNGKRCFYWRALEKVEDRCINTSIYDDKTDCSVDTKVTVWKYGCNYNNESLHFERGSNCCYNIEEEPKLCTDVWKDDYFIQYPDGIPDHRPLWQFLIEHADEFDIDSRRWSNDPPSVTNGFRKVKKFGSYELYADYWTGCFVLENNRNSFYFRYDVKNGFFIIGRPRRDIGYSIKRVFSESKYDYHLQKSVSHPIACWDKFSKWWGEVVNAYIINM